MPKRTKKRGASSTDVRWRGAKMKLATASGNRPEVDVVEAEGSGWCIQPLGQGYCNVSHLPTGLAIPDSNLGAMAAMVLVQFLATHLPMPEADVNAVMTNASFIQSALGAVQQFENDGPAVAAAMVATFNGTPVSLTVDRRQGH